MKTIGTSARLLLGLIFFVFGLNGFLHFIPAPPLPEPAMNLIGAMISSGYLFYSVKITEIVCGAMLLTNTFVPLALVLVAPVVVQIFLFHFFLAPEGLLLPIVVVALEAYLGFVVYRNAFRAVLSAK